MHPMVWNANLTTKRKEWEYLCSWSDNQKQLTSGGEKSESFCSCDLGGQFADDNRFTYKLLMETARDMVFIHRFSPTGNHGPFLEVSESACRALEYSKEELKALTPWDIIVSENSVEADERREFLTSTKDLIHEKVSVSKSGRLLPIEINTHLFEIGNQTYALSIARDISGRIKADKERENLIRNLQKAHAEIKTLRGILPLCSFCKRIRDDKGNWEEVDMYIAKYSEADITHSICPECMKKHYPNAHE